MFDSKCGLISRVPLRGFFMLVLAIGNTPLNATRND
uniref:Uncharacterized protein n=1 Tax=Nelumbo nucifera TaxID=4432 RepID=A0A822YAG0_NELNU|nr:TPA_asm: hypothetical protein HUJ06_029999 [Nelumbo nucifera]